MNIHIVRVNEKIERIASIYNLTKDEIVKINHHIQDWEHLIPGTKLRLPEIPENVELELDNTEPFIEEYYPKIDLTELNKIEQINNQNENIINNNYNNEKEIVKEESKQQTKINKSANKYPYYSYNPYYGYYQGYPKYYTRKTKNKKGS